MNCSGLIFEEVHSESSVLKKDLAFRYANDEDALKRLCGLK